MGLYGEQVVPRLVDVACGATALDPWRAQAVEGLAGQVVEIGFGTGHNVPLYPSAVEQVLAVEPAGLAWRLAEPRLRASAIPVQRVGLDGQDIPLGDASCDGALCTFTLCTVPDPARALDEVRRVLRPGARLHLLEHGLSPDAKVARWQHRVDPVQRRLAGGCHLDRDPVALLAGAGFALEWCTQRYVRGLKPWSWFTVAVATAPAA
jgi:SAM-dependent methyltransferase